MKVTDEMVNRFLSWNLPQDFNPDGGIAFECGTGPWPSGTNLLNAHQAREMLEHVLAETQPVTTISETLDRPDFLSPLRAVLDAHLKVQHLKNEVKYHSEWLQTMMNYFGEVKPEVIEKLIRQRDSAALVFEAIANGEDADDWMEWADSMLVEFNKP